MELISSEDSNRTRLLPTVIVDYAHSPDGLKKALNGVNPYVKRNLICVFGCGGDRDQTKRPLMGKIAAMNSNKIVVTSDNPRSENPNKIINDIIQEIPSSNEVIIQPDRKAAISFAVDTSGGEDLILIAGKGHENYQIIGSNIIDMDDRKIAEEALKNKLKGLTG